MTSTVSDLRGLTEYPWRGGGIPPSGIEGVEGNVRASRAWKGNGESQKLFLFPCLCSSSGTLETDGPFRFLPFVFPEYWEELRREANYK